MLTPRYLETYFNSQCRMIPVARGIEDCLGFERCNAVNSLISGLTLPLEHEWFQCCENRAMNSDFATH